MEKPMKNTQSSKSGVISFVSTQPKLKAMQKQSPESVLQNNCCETIHKIQRKIVMLRSFFGIKL